MDDALTFVTNLLDPAIWKRVGEVILGGVLILLALTQFTTTRGFFARFAI
jgi:hypothetical protein